MIGYNSPSGSPLGGLLWQKKGKGDVFKVLRILREYHE